MTIEEFKQIATFENFHIENLYGSHWYKYGLHIYKTVEKLTGKVEITYWAEVMNIKKPISKEKFLSELN